MKRYSQYCENELGKQVRSNQRFSVQHERISLNGRTRTVIHARIKPQINQNGHSVKHTTTTRDKTQQIQNGNGTLSSNTQSLHSIPLSLNTNRNSQQIQNSILQLNSQQQHNKSIVRGKQTKIWPYIADSHGNLTNKNRRKKKKLWFRWWVCLFACILTTLLVATALTSALLATLIRSQKTTTIAQLTITVTTITNATMTSTMTVLITTITSASTIITTVLTTTLSTAITTATTTVSTSTITSCGTPTNAIFHYSSTINSYKYESYNFTATYTGTAVLEFGFHSNGANKYGYLDDVSIVNRNASNSEMLINGNFESGDLTGWQVICTTGCSSASGTSSNSGCHSSTYCYKDGCKGSIDFLRQAFSITAGYTYTLSFWLTLDNTQDLYISIK